MVTFYAQFPFIAKSLKNSPTCIKPASMRKAARYERLRRNIQDAAIAAGWTPRDMCSRIKITLKVSMTFSRQYAGDLDNILGTIMDAGSGIVYHDDTQVTEITVSRTEDDRGLAIVTVENIGDGSDLFDFQEEEEEEDNEKKKIQELET